MSACFHAAYTQPNFRAQTFSVVLGFRLGQSSTVRQPGLFRACVCARTPAHGELAVFLLGIPSLLLMLGPTKTMSSRRVNVPAKRNTWVAESAAGILNGDRTHIPVRCCMLLNAFHSLGLE